MGVIKVKFELENGCSFVCTLEGNQQMTKNFKFAEIANNKAKEDIKLVVTPRVVKFVGMIQELRDEYKKPINVNSGYRTLTFNQSIFGDAKSRHLYGEAIDIWLGNNPNYEWFENAWRKLCIAYNEVGAINLYTHGVHIEIGTDRSYGNRFFVKRDYRKKKGDW